MWETIKTVEFDDFTFKAILNSIIDQNSLELLFEDI